jgi:hypothetical protein
MLFAERTKDVALAQAALSQINLAFETMRDSGNAPDAAYYEGELPKARGRGVRRRVLGRSCPDFEWRAISQGIHRTQEIPDSATWR